MVNSGKVVDTVQQLLNRSRTAIARFEMAKALGRPVELAEARKALELCHAEVKRFVREKKAMRDTLREALS